MTKGKVKEINLYNEVHGSGYPLVRIQGLSSNADHWYCQLPPFSSHYSAVVFDNRWIARADIPDLPFTISMMADDTVGLMDFLGMPRDHILGISMGGMIAQISLKHSQRVNRLILAWTHCGGKQAIQPDLDIIRIYPGLFFKGPRKQFKMGAGAYLAKEPFNKRQV